MAVRNGPLEDLHAGKHSKLLSDPSLSRITDTEMKELMFHAIETFERLLWPKQDNPEEYDRAIKSYNFVYCRSWDQ